MSGSNLKFHKMHGLGNDFIVIDAISQNVYLTQEVIQKISHRYTGIGCDQVLVLEKPNDPSIDFIYKIYNQDGSESGQCGNGARCLAKFIQDNHLSQKKHLRLKTLTTILEVYILDNDTFRVNMGNPKKIDEFIFEHKKGIFVDMGNPHIVFTIDHLNDSHMNNFGLDKYNVGFMKIQNKNHIRLRVFERGAGETLACGSGACAAVVAGITQGLLNSKVIIELALGNLEIEWQGKNHPVWMTGPAETSFTGEIMI